MGGEASAEGGAGAGAGAGVPADAQGAEECGRGGGAGHVRRLKTPQKKRKNFESSYKRLNKFVVQLSKQASGRRCGGRGVALGQAE